MKHNKNKREGGFSLVEMLVVVSVIGIIAAIAIPALGNVNGKASEAAAKRNAQNIAALFNNARSVGTEFSSTTKSGVVDELLAGVSGAEVSGSHFKLSGLSDVEKTAALGYLTLNVGAGLMDYDPSGGGASDYDIDTWTPFGGSPLYYGAHYDEEGMEITDDIVRFSSEAAANAKLEDLQASFPGVDFHVSSWGSEDEWIIDSDSDGLGSDPLGALP